MRVRVAAIIVDAGWVLLVSTRRGRPGYLVPPGGGVEEGEALAEAVEREVREEADLNVQAGSLLAYRELQTHRGVELELYFSAHLVAAGTAAAAPEDRQVRWVALEELPQLPHFPPQLHDLARRAAVADERVTYLGRADTRSGAEPADMTESESR